VLAWPEGLGVHRLCRLMELRQVASSYDTLALDTDVVHAVARRTERRSSPLLVNLVM
jgi:hypothetical protein